MNESDSSDCQLAELLDGYLARLQAGLPADREALIKEHPELASMLDCLEALETTAPTGDPEANVDGPATYSGFETDSGLGTLPREFGQYELLSEIGRGGMGVVYKARQTTLDRIVAIKMILASQMASPEHVRRFHAEARAAARLEHPNIVHIHEVGHLHGQHYLCMEYVEGESLARRLRSGPLEPREAVRIVAEIARAVECLHQANIIHRDLKPSNVLVDAEGRPYVADFGLAKFAEPDAQVTQSNVIAGTASYMPPEQAAGRTREVDKTADVYTLGAILYEMLTGRPPFREDSPLDTLMQVLGREPTAPRQLNTKVPRGLELICLKCLAKAPADRYPTAAALADELDRFARGDALEVRAPSLGQLLWSWMRRQPALAIRLMAFGLFYLIEWVNYLTDAPGVDTAFHLKMTVIVTLWAAASIVCQQFLRSRRWSIPARFVWGTLDSVFFLAVLLVADGAASPLVVGYFLLIAGAGLWFRVRFVWLMTGLSLVSYGLLLLDFYHWRFDKLSQGFDTAPDRHIIFVAALLVTAGVVAYLVHRVRLLSACFGRQNLP